MKIKYVNKRVQKADKYHNWVKSAYYLQDWYSRIMKIPFKDNQYIMESAKRLKIYFG
jgi:hypothetical protein